VDDPRQVTADIGMWSECLCYEMKNLCVRDVVHSPLLPELKLKSWWKPEYSRQLSADAEAAIKAGAVPGTTPVAAAGGGGGGGGGGGAAGGSGKPAAAVELEDDAPEKRVAPLLNALKAIRSGKINEKNAASATMEELEGMGFDDETGKKVSGGDTCDVMDFDAYFGFPRKVATAEAAAASAAAVEAATAAAAAAAATAAAAAAAAASPSPAAAATAAAADATPVAATPAAAATTADFALPPVFVADDGKMHRAKGAVSVFKKSNITQEDKVLDLKVYFSREFPMSVRASAPLGILLLCSNVSTPPHRRIPHLPAGCQLCARGGGHGTHWPPCRELPGLL